MKWMLDAMGAVGIARACHGLGDPGAEARCALAYFDGERLVTAVGSTRGRLATEPAGEHGFGWDPVFIPEESDRSYAELTAGEKDRFGHRGRAWRAFRDRLNSD